MQPVYNEFMEKGRTKLGKIVIWILSLIVLSFIYLSYTHYLDLKKVFISEISNRVSSRIGQTVRLGDISFALSSGINIRDITIDNPTGFGEGRLLSLKRLSLRIKYRELLKGRLSLRAIELETPELTLRRDKLNRFNISDELKSFLSKKTAIGYQIDTVEVHSGIFNAYLDRRYAADTINVTLDHVSSNPGEKTLISVAASPLGQSRLSAEGWAYLNSDPKKFAFSASLKEIELSLLGDLMGNNKFDAGESRADLVLKAEGNNRSGVDLKSTVHVKRAGFVFPDKKNRDIMLDADAFLDIRGDSLIIRHASLTAGDISTLEVKAAVKNLTRKPSYKAELRTDVRDLSAFNIIKGVTVRGRMTSESVRASGTFDKTMPFLEGSLQLRNVSVESSDAHAEKIKADMTFSSTKEILVRGEASGSILKAGEYTLEAPADARIIINARGKPESMALVSSLELFPLRLRIGKGKDLTIGHVSARIDGNLDRGTFSGKSTAEFRQMRVGNYAIKSCEGGTAITYRKDAIMLGNPDIKSERFRVSADSIKVLTTERKGTFLVDTKNLNGSYPEKKVEIKHLDSSLNLVAPGEDVSGNIIVSKGQVTFQGISSGSISGGGTFGRESFTLDIPEVALFKGTAKFSAKGKTSGGPFPLTMAVTLENADIRELSGAASGFFKIPYSLSGELDRASFLGKMESGSSISGSASLKATKLSIAKAGENKVIVRGGMLNSDASFRGKDMDFKADAVAGNLSVTLTGTVNSFGGQDRSIRIKAAIPEVGAADIRNTFWDVFPDKLLYNGLEGSLSADIAIGTIKGGLSAEGELRLKDLKIEGENNEYSVGPVNGIVPVHYSTAAEGAPPSLPSFEPAEFQKLSEYYAKKLTGNSPGSITIGSFRYGFKLFEDIRIWVNQNGRYLNVQHVGANIFGGRLDGSAVVSFTEGLNYRAGAIVKGISLTKLCDDIAPIKGYISGKVDGIALLKGTGGGIGGLIGKADFWTYSGGGEKTVISREFLQKIGGPSMKAYIGERPFGKGIISLYLENGFLIFRELEISHKNFFGVTDLSVKVAPFNNRIALDHLMETITEAAERAKEK